MKNCIFDIPHGPYNPRNSEGSFLLAKDGRIRFIYTRYNGADWGDHTAADLAEMISNDGGETWQDNGIILRRGDAENIMSVSLLRLQNGSVRLFYLQKHRVRDTVACIPIMRCSDDEGQSWSSPRRLIGHDGYYVMNNDRAVQMRSGRIILPFSFLVWRSGGRLGPGIVFTLFSDDDGETWNESNTMLTPDFQTEAENGFQEPGMIELEDGKLLLWIRTSRGFQYRSFSEDGGRTWCQPVPDWNFPSPCSPMSMKRDPADGCLYAVWNDTDRRHGVIPITTPRTPLALMRSRDNGTSWDNVGTVLLEKEPDHGYCYTAMLFKESSLLLAYCCGYQGGGASPLQDLRIRKIDLKELWED